MSIHQSEGLEVFPQKFCSIEKQLQQHQQEQQLASKGKKIGP